MAIRPLDLSFPVMSEPKLAKNLEFLYDQFAVFTSPSTLGKLAPNGISVISTTVPKAFTLSEPQVGVEKFIIMTSNTTVTHTLNTNATNVTFDGTNNVITFDAVNEYVQLVGMSSTRWLIKSSSGIALSAA